MPHCGPLLGCSAQTSHVTDMVLILLWWDCKLVTIRSVAGTFTSKRWVWWQSVCKNCGCEWWPEVSRFFFPLFAQLWSEIWSDNCLFCRSTLTTCLSQITPIWTENLFNVQTAKETQHETVLYLKFLTCNLVYTFQSSFTKTLLMFLEMWCVKAFWGIMGDLKMCCRFQLSKNAQVMLNYCVWTKFLSCTF